MAQWFGCNPPFLGGQEGVMSRQEDDRLIRNDLLQLLLTSPGERMMRSDFGTNIRRFVFQDMSDESIDQLKTDITGAIQKFEPRVTVTDVVLTPDMDKNYLDIKIYGYFNLNTVSNVLYTQNDANLLIQFGLPLNQIRQVTTAQVAQT